MACPWHITLGSCRVRHRVATLVLIKVKRTVAVKYFMTEQFKEQGGSATMDPSPMMRWVTSRAIRTVINPRRLERARIKAETQRLKQGNAHCVEYFHQVNDGYSHLAVQQVKY